MIGHVAMTQAQIVAYGLEASLVGRLQALAQGFGLWLREVQHAKACRNLVAHAGPAVLVLAIGKELVQELTLLQELSQASPATAVIVIGDTANPAVAALAWDLGARCVLQPPLPVELLAETVLRLLRAGQV